MYNFKPISPRIKKFREAVRNRVVEIETERAYIVTEAYKKYKDHPPILRRPMMTRDLFEQMTLCVGDTELFVGQVGKDGFNEETSISSSGLWPDWNGGDMWFRREWENGKFVDDGTGLYRFQGDYFEKVAITKEEYEKSLTFCEFWDENAFGQTFMAWQPDGYAEFTKLGSHEYFPGFRPRSSGHLTPGHHNLIRRGIGSIRKKAQDFVDAHKGDMMGHDIEKYMFYYSITIICDAMTTLFRRYAGICRDKAAACADAARKAELEMMADGLEWTSEKPARTFWEALQMVILYLMAISLDSAVPGVALGRVDYYTWPLLQKQFDENTISNERAQEMMDYFVLKSSNLFPARHPGFSMTVGAGNTFQHVTLGGVIPETGEDASNPVTYMYLETMARLYLHDPLTSLRIHKGTPKELWECAVAVTERVGGMPLFQNDDVIIPGLMSRLGFTLEDARDYSLIGCQEIVGSGTDYPEGTGTNCGGAVWYSITFVTALNNGVNPFNNVDSGVRTGYLYEMRSLDEVKAAMKTMMRWSIRWMTSMNNYSQWIGRWDCYHAILSISIDDCMEKGMDCHQGGARYNSFGATAVGLSTIGDSLTAIKYMCFDKKICTTRELFDAYMANWEGYEELQRKVLNEVPHYGNDDPYADEEMAWCVRTYVELCDEISTLRTDKYKAGMYSAAGHIAQGASTWATPDGRNTGQPIADAASCGQGRDLNGPIAVLNSATSFDHGCLQNGLALNLRFHPSVLQGDGHEKLAAMTQAYFENGGAEVQFNIVSTDTLREAKATPENYRDLIVRIAGYSAYFTELAPNQQDDLIRRQEHEAVR
ncbi:MAG: hypothetical protein FWH33_07570 [Oscillospiraceae bacterium]|nr:hypothetical protein [Oscillospiraceae bacterium]